MLPAYHRCAAHTLNLIANNEIDKWSNPESRAVHCSSTAKCSALWTIASQSTVASECLEEISEMKLIVPSVTRWNSFYDAYVWIIEMPLTDINNLCTQLQIKCMNDMEFLKEYCSIMKPFSVASSQILWMVWRYFQRITTRLCWRWMKMNPLWVLLCEGL